MRYLLFKTLLRAADEPGGLPAPPAPPPPSPPPPSPTPPASGGTTDGEAFWKAFPEDLQASHAVTKFKSGEELARAYVAMEKRLGLPPERLLTLPAEQTPESMADVYRAIGRPDTVDGYAIAIAEGAPDYVGAYGKSLGEELHKLGASKAVVDKVVELTNSTWQAQVNAENQKNADEQVRIEAEIRKQWGDQAEPMQKAVTQLLKEQATAGITDEAAKTAAWEALKDELAGGLGKSPILFGLLAKQVQARMEGGGLKIGDLAPSLQGAMSLDQATAAKNAFYADAAKMEAWRSAVHPNHKAVIDELENINRVIVNARKAKK